jgi:hypothetical protein
MAGNSFEGPILDCYRLAKFYATDPKLFLDKPMSEIRRHLIWTERLIERLNIEQMASD